MFFARGNSVEKLSLQSSSVSDVCSEIQDIPELEIINGNTFSGSLWLKQKNTVWYL